jgi:predicted nucleic acid-binding protein
MLYYLDTNIVIYVVEGQLPFRQRARNHLAALENAGHRFVISGSTFSNQPFQHESSSSNP